MHKMIVGLSPIKIFGRIHDQCIHLGCNDCSRRHNVGLIVFRKSNMIDNPNVKYKGISLNHENLCVILISH